MAKLQRPDLAYMNGKLIPWDDAVDTCWNGGSKPRTECFRRIKGILAG